MSKYIKRYGAKKEKLYVLMKIISVEMPVKEAYNKIVIEWKRGNKKSETTADQNLTPYSPVAVFLETFTKHSLFYKDNKTGKYHKKMALLKVKGNNAGGKEKLLGEIDLDIAEYVGKMNQEFTLTL